MRSLEFSPVPPRVPSRLEPVYKETKLLDSGQLITMVRMKKYFLHPGDLHLIFNLVHSSESFKVIRNFQVFLRTLFVGMCGFDVDCSEIYRVDRMVCMNGEILRLFRFHFEDVARLSPLLSSFKTSLSFFPHFFLFFLLLHPTSSSSHFFLVYFSFSSSPSPQLPPFFSFFIHP